MSHINKKQFQSANFLLRHNLHHLVLMKMLKKLTDDDSRRPAVFQEFCNSDKTDEKWLTQQIDYHANAVKENLAIVNAWKKQQANTASRQEKITRDANQKMPS